MEQLRPCTTTPEPVLQSLGVAVTEPTCHNKRSPYALQPVLHKTNLYNEKRAYRTFQVARW